MRKDAEMEIERVEPNCLLWPWELVKDVLAEEE